MNTGRPDVDSNLLLRETTESEMLTVTDIIRALGKDTEAEGKKTRSVISRYLEDEETRALLGASGPVRPAYPKESIPVFQALLRANASGEVTPKTLARHFSPNHSASTPILANLSILGNSGNALEAMQQNEMVQVMQEFISAVKDIVPVPEDRVLTRLDAADLLACAPRSVSRFVQPLARRRGVFRRSDCLRYIQTGLPVKNTAVTPSSVIADPHVQVTCAAVSKTDAEWHEEEETEIDKQQKKRLSDIENWLVEKMITKAEAELLVRVEGNGQMDPRDLDAILKIRQRVKAAKALAKNPHAAEDAQKLQAELEEALATTRHENARIAAGLD